MTFKPGDRVKVNDPGLAELRRIFAEAMQTEPVPNNTGIVDHVGDEYVYITFDDSGQMAPYPIDEVESL